LVTQLPGTSDDESGGSWALLTGHGHVLVEIARNPDVQIRDICPLVGLTQRTVQAIVADLEAAGYLTRKRIGRHTLHREPGQPVPAQGPARAPRPEGLEPKPSDRSKIRDVHRGP
jgi:hypothetical protein